MSRIATLETKSEFDAAYWASKPPAVRKLQAGTTPKFEGAEGKSAQMQYVDAAIRAGYQIDHAIMVNQWDPFEIMSRRIEQGYTSIQPAEGPAPAIAPGLTVPGDLPPVSGPIKVSLDFDDYPPYVVTGDEREVVAQ